MTDVPGANSPTNAPKAEQPKTDAATAASDKAMEEWKPEPRQWTWKDLFTAPMLAFKPKCMIISALTLVAITVWMWLCDTHIISSDSGLITQNVLAWVQYTVAIILFSLGASFVSVFLKADLLDDEFLSLGEAISQYKTRILPAVLVPLFLMSLAAGVYLALMYLPVLLSSIPYVGTLLYSLLYPLLFLFSLFIFVLTIAVWLSVFVFPAIIAIRKHGWFDNVVDTIEAVGTKPHVLFGSLLLSGVMMWVCLSIGFGSISQLKGQHKVLPSDFKTSVRDNEGRASDFYADNMMELFNRHVHVHVIRTVNNVTPIDIHPPGIGSVAPYNEGKNGFIEHFTGPVTGIWQIIIQGLILGYVLNLFISGGMLTYLVVREDDYWDDEDLEDLDKLAKELEEEAMRDQGVSPAAAAKPEEAAAPKPAEEKPAAEKPAENKSEEAKPATAEKAPESKPDEKDKPSEDGNKEEKKDEPPKA